MSYPIKLLANALGPPPADVIDRAHAAGVQVAALVGRAEQAQKQQAAGVDIIVAAGYEAGGHTGDVSTLVLVPEVVDAVAPLPVLAAGGIGSGRQMAAALALGAQGVWTGSIWLTTNENDGEPVITERLLAATSNDTVRTRCITGKPARMLRSRYIEAAHQRVRRAALAGSAAAAELTVTPVGQIVGRMNQMRPARQVVSEMVDEYIDTVERMARLMDETEKGA